MTDTILELVKYRLNRMDGALDGYLTSRIVGALERLDGMGIHIKDTVGDALIVCDLVCWEYGNRDVGASGENNAMPEWLRMLLRQRFLTEKGGGV